MTAQPITPPTRPGPLKLTPQQYAQLLREIPRERVSQDPQGNSHVEAWDVRRTLTRIFGFGGWESRTKALTCVREIEYRPGELVRMKRGGGGTYANEKTVWTVVYSAEVALTVYGLEGTSATFEDGASGKSENQPSLGDAVDQALKTALSQGLKRCAVNLGDQFGLGLYNNGKTAAVVTVTLRPPAEDHAAAAPAMPKDEQVAPEPGTVRHDDGQTYVDPDDGQTYVTPPSGGLADDMRDADVHPLPPARQAATVTPLRRGPVEEQTGGETAAQRAIRQRREADQARHRGEASKSGNTQPAAAARTQQPRNDGDAAALVDEILSCTDSDRFRGPLWNMAKQIAPAGLDTDVRRFVDPVTTEMLRLDRSQLIPLGALVQRAAEHFDRAAVSVRMTLSDPATV